MRKSKKITALLLAVIMAFSVFKAIPFTAIAAEAEEVAVEHNVSGYSANAVGATPDEAVTSDGFKYCVIDDGTAEIIEYTGTAKELVIPSELDGCVVTSIGYRAFYDCTNLNNVEIGNGVTSIGHCAFENCTNLNNVEIGNGVTSIGPRAFENCTNLKNVIIGSSVTSIGDQAFSFCSSLTSITIPDSVTKIDDYTFANCSSLTSVTIPDSVTSINYGAFLGCTSLINVAIPYSVAEIGGSVFGSCTSLTSITIPYSVTSIGLAVFSYCASLKDITVDTSNENYCSIDGVLFNKGATELICYPAGKIDESYTILYGVNIIGYNAFFDCSNLTRITIPDSVTSIDRDAFCECTSLTDITIPDSVTTIGGYAFEGCKNLTSVTIPDSVTEIDGYVFFECTGLQNITIPDSVTSIGEGAFYDCYSLSDVYYSGGKEEWENIDIEDSNEWLTDAAIHYNYTSTEPSSKTTEPNTSDTEPTDEPTLIRTIFFKNTLKWDKVYAYIWDYYGCNGELVSWPGTAMIKCGTDSNGYDIYKIDIDTTKYDYIIFSNNGVPQTVDIPLSSDVNAYYCATLSDSGTYKVTGYNYYEETTTEPTTPTATCELGDVDGDGHINIKDVTKIQFFIVESISLSGEAQKCADVNFDEVIDIRDATRLQLYIAEAISSFV